MEHTKKPAQKQVEYEAPRIIEKKELTLEMFSDEPPVEPPWPGP